MAWGNKDSSATQLTGIGTAWQWFDVDVLLNPEETVHAQIEIVFPAGVDTKAQVAAVSTLDQTLENEWDDESFFADDERTVESDPGGGGTKRISMSVRGLYRVQFGVRSLGGGNLTSADLVFRVNQVSV